MRYTRPEVERMYPPSKFAPDARAALARGSAIRAWLRTHEGAPRQSRPFRAYNFNVPWAVGSAG
jgi:hypothetical protein